MNIINTFFLNVNITVLFRYIRILYYYTIRILRLIENIRILQFELFGYHITAIRIFNRSEYMSQN
jgi:hypothetical protein